MSGLFRNTMEKAGGIAGKPSVFTATCILLFLLLTFAAHKGVERYSLKLDLTENALYEFSETTVQAARGLDQDIQITVFNREEEYVVMLREVLKRFAALSPRITLRFVDPYENPVLLDSYAARNTQVHQDDIVLETAEPAEPSGDGGEQRAGNRRIRVFSIKDMYLLNASGSEILGLRAEQRLVSALQYLASSELPSAAFVDGHNERPSRSLIQLFESNNFEVLRGTLASLVSRRPRLLVIAAPGRDLNREDLLLLERYADEGGNVLVFLEPSLAPLPHLEGFLKERGILAGEELVLEEQAYTGNNPLNIVPMYDPHMINRYFMETRVFLTMPSSRSLYMDDLAGSALDVRSVLSSTPGSYGKTGFIFDSPDRKPEDPAGPFSLALSSELELDGGQSSLVLAVGSRGIYADDLMGFSSYGNSEFLVQAVNWLAAEEITVNIPPKKIQADPLNLQFGIVLIWGILFCGLLPLIVLVTGFVVFLRRRRL